MAAHQAAASTAAAASAASCRGSEPSAAAAAAAGLASAGRRIGLAAGLQRAAMADGGGGPAGAVVIDGKAMAAAVTARIAAEVEVMRRAHGKVPGLAVVIVGDRKDSQTYVRMKRKACADAGIRSEQDILNAVKALNANPDVHGILVQLPFPKHVNEERVLNEISVEKDVDGFHPLNIGNLCMKGHTPLFAPCTRLGCMELLEQSGVSISGKRAVVVGRSNIVGLPVAMMLLERDATVTVVHSRTTDPAHIVRDADIVVAAAGQAEMVKADWIKPGAAVIDVGTNAVDDPTKKAGYRLVGDVDYGAVKQVAGWITPVPGGVGPMTIAMLLDNTLLGAKRTYN
eukprot:SM000054S18080  [mRNA]  locus=s54:263889:265779:- [translate_table: standard]